VGDGMAVGEIYGQPTRYKIADKRALILSKKWLISRAEKEFAG